MESVAAERAPPAATAAAASSSSSSAAVLAKEQHPSLRELKSALQADWAHFWRDVEGAAERHWQRQEDLLARFASQLSSGGAAGGAAAVSSGSSAAAGTVIPFLPQKRSDRGSLSSEEDSPVQALGVWQAPTVPPVRKQSSGHTLDSATDGSEPPQLSRRPKSSTRRLHELSTNISRIKGNRPEGGGLAPASEADTDTGYTGYSTPMTGMTGTPMTGSVMGLHHGRNDVLVHALAPLSATLYKVEAMLREQKRDVKEVMRVTRFNSGHSNPNSANLASSVVSLDSEVEPPQDQCAAPGKKRDSLMEDLRIEEVRASHEYHSEMAAGPEDSEDDPPPSASIGALWHRRCKRYLKWWTSLEEPERTGRLAELVRSSHFETICTLVIVSNGIYTVYASNYEIAHLREISHPFAVMLEVFFLLFYTAEITVKLAVHRWYFFSNDEMNWNIFDFSLVLFAIFDRFLILVLGNTGSDVSFLRALRILKIAKILRGLRVMRFFTELRLMLNSLLGSLSSLFWSIVMLLLIFYIFGLVMVQGASLYLIEQGGEVGVGQPTFSNIMDTFGSVQTSMLTLYMVATGGDDWSTFYEVAEVVGFVEALVFLIFVAFIQIALMNILTGIFVENAMKLAQPDREALALERRKKLTHDAEELKRLFVQMGAKTGSLSSDMFKKQMRKSKVMAHFAVLGLDVRDANSFFDTLAAASENNEVDIKTFVDGCMRLKGPATSIDLQSLAFETRVIHRFMRRLRHECMDQLQAIGQRYPVGPPDDSIPQQL